MEFRILHISDIHFQDTNTAGFISRRKITDRIKGEDLRADCIIISGDLFHQGALKKEDANECEKFISELQDAAQVEGQLKPTVLVVPGNHDLDRLARLPEVDSYNVFVKRSDIVNRAGKVATSNSAYSLENQTEKDVIYQEAFKEFGHFASKIKSLTYTEPGKSDEYEVQQRTLWSADGRYGVQIILMNTALFAGQNLEGKEFWERRKGLEEKKREMILAGDEVGAAELSLQIAKVQRDYELYHAVIVDEEKCEATGAGRLGLSREGERKLQGIVPAENGIVCTLFVGHHGYEFLSDQTRVALFRAMMNCAFANEAIYLCGHAHQVRLTTVQTRDNQNFCMKQAQAGVLFGGDGFSEYGFNHITISDDQKNGDMSVAGNAHYLINTPTQREKWYTEPLFDIMITGSVKNAEKEDKYTKNTETKDPEDGAVKYPGKADKGKDRCGPTRREGSGGEAGDISYDKPARPRKISYNDITKLRGPNEKRKDEINDYHERGIL